MSLTINHQTNDISATSGSVTLDGSAVGGGGGSWNLISTTTVSSAVTSVDFTSISGYKTYALDIRLSFNYGSLNMRFGTNGSYDSGSNYEGATGVSLNSSGYKYGVIGIVYIRDLERATTTNFRRASIMADVLRLGSSSVSAATVNSAYYGNAGANCITLISETNKIVEGTVSLYGLSS